jgi:hypothetical protein
MSSVEFVAIIIDVLEKLGIPYMVVGSFSSNVYGQPRSTKDADFVIELSKQSISSIAAALGPDFELDPQMSFETVTATTRYKIKHRSTAFVIELFLLSDDPHDQSRFARRVIRKVGERSAFVPTAEDVVITKLRWSKQGRRQKDVLDVESVLALRHNELDLPYIRSWCDQHNTRDLFERLLLESQKFDQERP